MTPHGGMLEKTMCATACPHASCSGNDLYVTPGDHRIALPKVHTNKSSVPPLMPAAAIGNWLHIICMGDCRREPVPVCTHCKTLR